jgi:hypothetical protein
MTPQLEGNARKGGQILGGRGLDLARDRLTKIADSHKEAFSVFDHLLGNELSVKYNCIKTGSATLNMIIPLAMHDDLHFRCAPRAHPTASRSRSHCDGYLTV